MTEYFVFSIWLLAVAFCFGGIIGYLAGIWYRGDKE